MPHLSGMNVSGAEITGGQITAKVVGADGKETSVAMYNAAQFEKPDGPHSVVTASDGSQWYQMASGAGAGAFYDAPQFNGKKIRPFIIPIVVTLVVLVLFHSIFMLGYVPTESMEPTLETGSLILGLRIFDELETGDIIIFRRDGSYLVKRIAACAGDTIDHQNSIVTVPDNCYYVLGDNAENSHDSRYWADPYVSHEDVIAKLLMPIK